PRLAAKEPGIIRRVERIVLEPGSCQTGPDVGLRRMPLRLCPKRGEGTRVVGGVIEQSIQSVDREVGTVEGAQPAHRDGWWIAPHTFKGKVPRLGPRRQGEPNRDREHERA